MSARYRIAIVGAESSGKTTLCHDLASHFAAAWLPEFAREYFEQKNSLNYDIEDIVRIGAEQLRREQIHPAKLLFCDSNLLINRIWAEVRFGRCPEWITQHYRPHDYLLHLLPTPDIPWEPDPLRENPHDREALFDRYQQALIDTGCPYLVVTGTRDERVQQVVQELRRLLPQGLVK